MADIAITAANVAISSVSAATVRKEYTYAATVTAGQVVYLNASNQWALADANAPLGTGATTLRGISLNGGAVGQPAAVCTADPAFVCGGTIVNGTSYYLSQTPGGITATLPTTGDQPVFLGLGSSTTVLVLNPTATGVTI